MLTNDKKQESNNSTDQTPKKLNKALKFSFLFIIGIAIFILLYINFQSIYKIKNILPQKSEIFNTIITTSAKKDTSYTNAKEAADNDLLEKPEVSNKNNNVNSTEDKIFSCLNQENINCTALLSFTQDYYIMHSYATKGQDFSESLVKLQQYKINSEDLKQNLSYLMPLANKNNSIEYLSSKFAELIKLIYKNSRESTFLELSNYFLIRKINDRALKSDDLDNKIFIIEKALANNNLSSINEELQLINQNFNSFNIFKIEMDNKVKIESSMSSIEKILLSKPDCNIVSK
ncbi:MAG: hypothetical protein WBJ81_01100 [Rickettsiales bacterium]